MQARPSVIPSFFDANEGPRKFVLLPFRQLLGGLGACWTPKLKCSSRRPRRPNSATRLRPLSGFGFAHSKIDGDAEIRSGAFVVLPRPCRLSPNCKPKAAEIEVEEPAFGPMMGVSFALDH